MGLFTKYEERWLFAPKILYFVINMQYYTLHQFRSAFALEKFRVPKSHYGIFTGFIMFITFFTNIAIGGYSDKRRNHKSMLFYLTIITTVAFTLFYFEPFMSLGKMVCFWSIMLVYLVFNNPKQPLLDKIILDYLSNIPCAGPEAYGRQRLWGTLAYGAATYISEALLIQKGKKEYNFNNLLLYAFVTTALAVSSVMVFIRPREITAQPAEPEQKEEEEEQEHRPEETGRRSNSYMTLLKNSDYVFFIAIMFSNAVTRSAMTLYLNNFHREVLELEPYDLPKSWPGPVRSAVDLLNSKPITALTFFGIGFEVLVMFVSKGIIDRFGLFWPLLVAQMCALVRFFAYFTLKPGNPHAYGLSCAYELIKGVYFGLAHISAVQIAMKLSPTHLAATSQMIYQGTFNALGSLVSGLVFGMMFGSKLKSGSGNSLETMFGRFFLVNALICMITILVYVYKYGVKDGVLFSRQAEDAKLNAARGAPIEAQ